MRCTYCHTYFTRAEFDARPLVPTNGGRQTYGAVVHEYRVCKCGSHVLLVSPRLSSRPPVLSASTPSSVPVSIFVEAGHARRK